MSKHKVPKLASIAIPALMMFLALIACVRLVDDSVFPGTLFLSHDSCLTTQLPKTISPH